MIKTEMYCDFCGKMFFSEYWDGGYIDHYENFSRHYRHAMIGASSNSAFNEIVKHGNDLRDIDDIKERLDCFMSWPDVNDDVKNETKKLVDILILKMENARDKAKEIVSGMTMLERRFLVDAAKKNGSRPYGYEDGKLFD